jgi:uncharacterized membrane protein
LRSVPGELLFGGFLIDALRDAGHSAASAHTGAFVLLSGVQAASLCWFYFCSWQEGRARPR